MLFELFLMCIVGLVLFSIMYASKDIFILALCSLTMFSLISKHKRIWKEFKSVWSYFHPIMIIEAIVALAAVIVIFLMLDNVPFLKYGWFNLFSEKGGNVYFAPVIEKSKSVGLIQWLPFIFFLVTFFMLPGVALIEEKIFRQGRHNWLALLGQALPFGLAHCLVGVPLSAGIAIGVSGLIYGLRYRRVYLDKLREFDDYNASDFAVHSSAALHNTYNSILIVILIIVTFPLFGLLK